MVASVTLAESQIFCGSMHAPIPASVAYLTHIHTLYMLMDDSTEPLDQRIILFILIDLNLAHNKISCDTAVNGALYIIQLVAGVCLNRKLKFEDCLGLLLVSVLTTIIV